MLSSINSFYNSLFKDIREPYIPLLRILLVLISMKEAFTSISKFRAYFQSAGFFHRDDFLSDFLASFLANNLDLLYYGCWLFGIMSVIGLFSRISLALYFLIYFSSLYFDVNMGIYNHEAGLTAQILLVLIFSPGIRNISLDSILRKKVSLKSVFTITPYSNWSVRMILILIAIGYFTAGISKVRYGGMDWLDGETLSYYLSGKASHRNEVAQKFILSDSPDWKGEFSIDAYTYGNFQTKENLLNFARSVSENKPIMVFLSIFTVLFEILAVVILFSKPLKNVVFIMAIGFHFSIRIFMGLGFLDYQIICLSLIDWKYLYQHSMLLVRRLI